MAVRVKCPSCGKQSASCTSVDIGGVDFLDRFSIYCSSCGFSDSQELYGGTPATGGVSRDCPYLARVLIATINSSQSHPK